MSDNNNELKNTDTNNTNTNKSNKKNNIIIAVTLVVLIVLIGLFYSVYNKKEDASNSSSKNNANQVEVADENNQIEDNNEEKAYNITVEIISKDGKKQGFQHKTDAKYLRQALEEIEGITIEGDESATGLYVKTINGVTADYSVDKSYWAFYVNNEYCQTGVDTQKVSDGDVFRIEYTKEK